MRVHASGARSGERQICVNKPCPGPRGPPVLDHGDTWPLARAAISEPASFLAQSWPITRESRLLHARWGLRIEQALLIAMVSLRDMYRRPLILSAVLVACGVLAILRSSPRSYILVPDRRGGTEKAQILLPADYYTRTPSDHFRDHVDHLFAPWQCLADADDSSFCMKPITSKSLSALEWLAKGGAYRIRFTGTDILYRPLTVFGQTYKKQRLEWIMNTIRDMSDAGMLTRTVNGKPGQRALASFARSDSSS